MPTGNERVVSPLADDVQAIVPHLRRAGADHEQKKTARAPNEHDRDQTLITAYFRHGRDNREKRIDGLLVKQSEMQQQLQTMVGEIGALMGECEP